MDRPRRSQDPLYCICRTPNDSNKPMIGCDFCKEWYHFTCVKVDPTKSRSLKKYKCPICKKKDEEKRLFRIQQEKEALEASLALRPVRYICQMIECKNMARIGSKYCKDSCGIESTRKILRNIELLKRIQLNNRRSAAARACGYHTIKLTESQNHPQHHLLEKHQLSIKNEPNSSSDVDMVELSSVEPLSEHLIVTTLNDMKDLQIMEESLAKCDVNIMSLEDRKSALEKHIADIQLLTADNATQVFIFFNSFCFFLNSDYLYK